MAQRLEDLLDIVGLQALETPVAGMGMNFTGTPNINYLQNLANLAQQQGPVLGPDDFGSYTIPASDPTYRSGFDYARSIAGGIPMSQVIAPGVSYSPEMPMGYTQEQLTTPVGTTPVEPPPTQEPDDPRYLGTGIGGVNIPVDRDMKMPPLRDIFGGLRDTSSLENLMNIGKLFSGGIDQEAIDRMVQERIAERMPTIEQPDFSQFVRREDIPTFEQPDLTGFARLEDIPQIPTREDFLSIAREGIDIPMPQQPDVSQFVTQEDINRAIAGIDIPTYQAPDLSGFARLEDIPSFDPSVLKQDILMSLPQTQVPDISQFVTQDDITKAIAGIDMPTFQQPDLSAYDTRIAELEQQLAGLQQPTGGRFSVDQQLPRGLF